MANDTTIRVGLEDKASGGIRSLADNVKSFGEQFKNSTPHVSGATAEILRFATGVTIGNLATLAARKGLQELQDQFTKAIGASNKMASAMIGLSSVAGAYGESQDKAREAAQSLATDGLLTVGEAAEGLKNLLGSGLNIDEATRLMLGFKDAAAFNRQGTLEFGQAIIGATEGIKNQNSILVDNVGVTKNLSVILKEAGLSVDDLSKVSSDASVKQKLLNGLLRETSIFAGDAARASQTLQGAQARLNTSVTMLYSNIGFALTPALLLALDALNGFATGINASASPALANIAKFLVDVTAFVIKFGAQIVNTGNNIVGVLNNLGNAGNALIHLDFAGVSKSIQQINTDADAGEKSWKEWSTAFDQGVSNVKNKIDKDGLVSFPNIFREAVEKMPPAVDEAAQKIAERIAKENRDFAEAVAKQAKEFEQSLKDLVIAHNDKTKQLTKDINEENSNFADSMADRKKSFDKTMADIEDRHAEKVKNITDQMIDERKKISDEEDKIKNKYKEDIDQFKSAMQQRLADLQVSLDKELAKGQFTDSKKVTNLQSMIKNETIALGDQLNVKNGILSDELRQVDLAHKDKIDSLKKELVDENDALAQAKQDAIDQYADETAHIQKEHDKRLASLNEELNKEREIQKKYADDFARFKDAVAEDDIARLKREYADQRAEAEREHQERLQDIARQKQEEIATQQAAQVRSNNSYQQQAQQQAQQASQAVQQTATKVSQQLSQTISKSLNTPQQTAGSSAQLSSSSGGNSIFSNIGTAISNVVSGIKNFFGFAEGGIVTKPTAGVFGEDGAEALIPLTKPDKANQILTQIGAGTLGGGKGDIYINMPVTMVNTETDIDLIIERVAYQLNKQGLR